MRTLSVFGLFVVAAFGSSTPALTVGPPDAFSDTQQNVTETIPFEGACGGRRRDGDDYLQRRLPCHAVREQSFPRSREPDREFVFDPDDPALANSTGSFTNGFNDTGNSNVFSSTSSFSASPH
jgi:hypothetical protein